MLSQSDNEQNGALTVSAAIARAKANLESMPLSIIGEVSELANKPGYKAVYFSIKDESATISCMMWNNRFQQQGVRLAVGQLVEVRGRFTIYAAKGRMNFDVFSLALAGEGRLRMMVAETARKLQAEGLMDPARKKPLPEFPERIGLVTSPRGDAVHDVLRTLRRRFPSARILLAGVPVEGMQAPTYLAEGIRCVAASGAQVLLLVRGGGSYEDLMPFNDEMLVRTIAACPIPVITGIGHEPDTTIADMVADCRASTPTAAAEIASAPALRLKESLAARKSTLCNSMTRRIEQEQQALRLFQQKPFFIDANYLFSHEAQTLDYLEDRLGRSLPGRIGQESLQIENLAGRLHRSIPLNLQRDSQKLALFRQQLSLHGLHLLERPQHQISLRAARLHDLSPLAVLARGYALTTDEDGHVVDNASYVVPGQKVHITLKTGRLDCRVEEAHCDTAVE